MRSAVHGRGRDAAEDDDDADARPGLLERLGWSHRDAVGFIVAAFAVAAILVNMLFLQPGPHRAPIVATGIVAAPPNLALSGTGSVIPQPQPLPSVKTEPGKAAPRANAEIVADIQRELSRRGFYDGAVDGRYGPKTDAAIRDFEQTVGLRPSGQPSEELLRAIARSPIKSRPAAPRKQAAVQARPDPIGELLAPSSRVMAVQRALTEFGYGQINPTGILDHETQQAIERFERAHRLPVTGQLSHRVVRELASITGRPLE